MKLPSEGVAVKICGITRPQDAAQAVAAGADLLGFNTWAGTKRFIDLRQNADWIAPLPVLKVALFVNASLVEVRQVAELPWIDALQLHGDEDGDFCRAASGFGKPIIKAVRPASGQALPDAAQYSAQHVLLDAHVPGAFGGTGARVDVGLAREFTARFPQLVLWLAGGLKPENVAEAIAVARPRVVDVSSGVESEPARKDPGKMRDFVAAAKGA